jgi:hypothetical protein
MNDSSISREIADLASVSITGNPRRSLKATGVNLTLVWRLRKAPMNRLSCVNQHANIRVINRREQFPCLYRYLAFYIHHFLI